jgi:lysophospholipase L1-like esterase
MRYQNVELHNIADVHAIEGLPGLRMQRVPETVRQKLNERAQERMLSPACAEIRGVPGSSPARVTLSCPCGVADAVLFHGPFQSTQRYVLGEAPQTIELAVPDQLHKLDPAWVSRMPYSPAVCRLMLWGDPVHLHGVEGAGLRPPAAEELPRTRLLAYGTSITHGFSATGPHLCYIAQAARRLGIDLINLGVGGAAFCEPELADYMAARKDWDLAVLALSCNMMGERFPPDAFYERVAYMVNSVAGTSFDRPVACVTIYPRRQDLLAPQYMTPAERDMPGIYRQRLRDAVANCPSCNVHLLEGPEILTDPTGLTPDLVHPADNGMIDMGENLANQLRPLLAGHI